MFDADLKYGTVGAVARDSHGHLAAATSTGGLTGKRWGRIGDSPIDRRRHLCRRSRLRGVGDRVGRILHPRRRRARDLRAGPAARRGTLQAAADAVQAESKALGGSRRCDRRRPRRHTRVVVQHAGNVPRPRRRRRAISSSGSTATKIDAQRRSHRRRRTGRRAGGDRLRHGGFRRLGDDRRRRSAAAL